MGAAVDCELIGQGFLGQPVNSLTTLAFVVAGAFLLRHSRLRWVGVALIATGVGSFLFHGPMSAGSQWAHDVSLAWLILVIVGLGYPWERLTRLPGLAVIAVVFALAPPIADPVAVVLTVIALATILQKDHSLATVALFAILGIVAILGRLGATGGPLCNPTSLWQWHGLWHVGASVAVAWWALTRPRDTGRLYPG